MASPDRGSVERGSDTVSKIAGIGGIGALALGEAAIGAGVIIVAVGLYGLRKNREGRRKRGENMLFP